MERRLGKIVLALGVFDGVHRGHRHIFAKVVARARAIGGKGVAYTFDPHPARVLVPQSAPPMILTLSQRLEKIRGCGIGQVIVQKFTPAFATLSPEKFLREVILKKLKAHEIFVGYDFTFGHHRAGTAQLMQKWGKETGIAVRIVDPFLWKETLVSSTQIREHLRQGQIEEAEELLGSAYRMGGTVIRGRGIGGKLLGIHTANLRPENDLILPTGVYASRALVGKKRFASVTNIGPNPTFGPGTVSIETHLLNFNRSILGKRMTIEFVKKIREEITFSSPEQLSTQIQNDIRVAKRCLKKI